MKKRGKLVREMYGGEEYVYYPLGKYVVSCPEVCQGRPTFKYTRVLVSGALNWLSGGNSIQKLVDNHQGRIPYQAVLEALDLAGKALESKVAAEFVVGAERRRRVKVS